MSSTVTLDEKQVLQVVHEYLESTGRVECLVALENSAKYESGAHVLPTELAFLRKLCLNGSWDDVNEYLQVFAEPEEKDGFKNCLYEAAKQQYLEVISTKLYPASTAHTQFGASSKLYAEKQKSLEKVRLKVLTDLLSKLKKLCLTNDDYSTLKSLVELPSLDASPEHATWSVFPARLRCFHIIATWVSNVLYPFSNFESMFPLAKTVNHQTLASSTNLVKLVAKGFLYEKCEETCMHRCGEDKKQDDMEVLDLSGWMQQQPDSAYQLSPSRCRLVLLPHSATQPTTQNIQMLSKSLSVGSNELITKPARRKQNIASQSVPEFTVNATLTKVAEEDHEHTESQSSHCEIHPPMRDECLEKIDESLTLVQQQPQIETVDETKRATRKKSTGIQVREADSTHHKIRVLEEFEDNFVDTPPHFQPPVKSGRDSSTPKPSSNKLHLQPSPPTSPVTFVTNPQGVVTTPQRARETAKIPEVVDASEKTVRVEGHKDTLNVPRRRFDFNETTEENSIEWPTATLLSQVTDTQAVRSVAFSQYGTVVAIGANSKTLRLCSTSSLLEGKVGDAELPVFYHHASYHKGSIYCLAWRGETLLVSGSNDHRLRLLSYDPDRSNMPCKSLGDMNFHKGTIRDVIFTPGGQLVSGGAVDTTVKISDCVTKQVVTSLVGHTEQVLTLDVIQENVIASGSQDKTINIWDVRQGKPFFTLQLDHPVTSLSVSTSRNEIISSHVDGSCTIHDLTSAKVRATYHPHTDDCRSVKYCPSNEQWILSGSYDGTVCLAEPGSLEWQQIGEHSDKVVQCRWHCEGSVFATTGADKKACFWSLS